MKKVIFILALVLLSASMVIPTNAAPELTQKQAEDLLIDAYNRFVLFQDGIVYSDGKYLIDDHIKADSMFQSRTLFDAKSDGTPYQYSTTIKKLDYIPVTDVRFNTLEKCYDYVEEVFTEEWAYKILNLHYYRGYWGQGEEYEVVRLSNGGKLYSRDGSSFEPWEDDVVMILFMMYPGLPVMKLDEIGALSVSGNTAQIAVTAHILESHRYDSIPSGSIDIYPAQEDKEMSFFYVPYDMHVNFEYTQNGWRVSGGYFFDTLMNRWANPDAIPSINPSTSDTTPVTVAILGTVAVISLALPIVLYKKRRRA